MDGKLAAGCPLVRKGGSDCQCFRCYTSHPVCRQRRICIAAVILRVAVGIPFASIVNRQALLVIASCRPCDRRGVFFGDHRASGSNSQLTAGVDIQVVVVDGQIRRAGSREVQNAASRNRNRPDHSRGSGSIIHMMAHIHGIARGRDRPGIPSGRRAPISRTRRSASHGPRQPRQQEKKKYEQSPHRSTSTALTPVLATLSFTASTAATSFSVSFVLIPATSAFTVARDAFSAAISMAFSAN